MWAHELGAAAGVTVPLHAAEHFYIVTEPIPGLPTHLPVLRDADACTYFKEDAGKLLVGWFEPVAKPWGMDGIPETFSFETLPQDLEHIEPLLEGAIRRVPALATAGIQLFFNGPESFTPDDRYLLGETPEVRRLFVAAGFNSIGIQSAGGAGKVLADWIADGHPPMDLWDVDIRRAMPFQRNRRYLRDRTVEALGLLYAMHWPFRQPETARGVRRSPFCTTAWLPAAPASARPPAGSAPTGSRRRAWKPEYVYSYGRQNWFEHSAAEHQAVRNAVGLFDQSSFGKFVLEGPDAEAVLNTRLGQPAVGAGRPHRLHAMAQRARRHRGRPDGDPGSRAPLPRRLGRRDPDARPRLAAPPYPRGGPRRRLRRHLRLCRAGGDGPAARATCCRA